MRKQLTLCLLLTLALPALADSVIFSCTTTNKKVVKVTATGSKVKYTFGSPGKNPDLAFEVPRKQVVFKDCTGTCGRYNSLFATIPNGQYAYQVYFSADRTADEHAIDAGVNVTRAEEPVNTVKCANKYKIVNNIDSLE